MRGRAGVFFGDGVEMAAVSNDGWFECLDKFGARFKRLPNSFRTTWIVVAGMNAVLIDGRCRAHDAERIEEMNVVPLFGQTDGGRGTVDSRSSYSDLCSHELLRKMLPPSDAAQCEEFCTGAGTTGTSMPSRIR